MKYEIPEMLKRGKGAIVNNGSVTGLVGMPGPIVFCTRFRRNQQEVLPRRRGRSR
jgi:NADP-dependent 3-hydroxy acid dehydrogenase YdfG